MDEPVREPNGEAGTQLIMMFWFTIIGLWVFFKGEPDLHTALIEWLMK